MAKVQKIHEQVKGVSNAARVRIKHTEEDCEKAVKEFEDKLDGKEKPKDVGGVAGERLNSFILRVERLEEEKAALLEDIKHVYAEAKAVGFDTKTIRKIIQLRKMDAEKRREEEELLSLYMSAIGMQTMMDV